MYIQSIFPFVIFHFEKDEKILVENCIKALGECEKKYGDKLFNKATLEDARKHYEKLAKELEEK